MIYVIDGCLTERAVSASFLQALRQFGLTAAPRTGNHWHDPIDDMVATFTRSTGEAAGPDPMGMITWHPAQPVYRCQEHGLRMDMPQAPLLASWRSAFCYLTARFYRDLEGWITVASTTIPDFGTQRLTFLQGTMGTAHIVNGSRWTWRNGVPGEPSGFAYRN